MHPVKNSLLLPPALGLNTRDGRRLAMMASLDHSLHFYASIDPSDWMLYHVRPPAARCKSKRRLQLAQMTFQASGSGRAVVHGAIYNREGKLAALAHQEGVVRAQPPRVSGGGGGGATAKL